MNGNNLAEKIQERLEKNENTEEINNRQQPFAVRTGPMIEKYQTSISFDEGRASTQITNEIALNVLSDLKSRSSLNNIEHQAIN